VAHQRALAVSSQRRAIAKSSFVPGFESRRGSNSRPFQERGRIGGERQAVKEGIRISRRPHPRRNRFSKEFHRLRPSYKRAIAPKSCFPRCSGGEAADLFKKRADPLFAGYFCLNDHPMRRHQDRPSVTTPQHDFAPAGRTGAAVVSSLCVGTFVLVAAPSAFAQGKLDARYEATLAAFRRQGRLDHRYFGRYLFRSGFRRTSGLLKAFAGGSGTGGAQGRVVNGALVATSYSATTTTSKNPKPSAWFCPAATSKEYTIEPEPRSTRTASRDRCAAPRSLRPMTGFDAAVPGQAIRSADACRTGAAVFDGRMRYDLKLDFKRMETVKAERGYHGPVVVCAIYFTRSPAISPTAP